MGPRYAWCMEAVRADCAHAGRWSVPLACGMVSHEVSAVCGFDTPILPHGSNLPKPPYTKHSPFHALCKLGKAATPTLIIHVYNIPHVIQGATNQVGITSASRLSYSFTLP